MNGDLDGSMTTDSVDYWADRYRGVSGATEHRPILANLEVRIPNLKLRNKNDLLRLQSVYMGYQWISFNTVGIDEYMELPLIYVIDYRLNLDHVNQLRRQSALSDEQIALCTALILKGVIK